MIVTAHQAEPLDALIWRATGRGADALAAVLAANPGIAASGEALAEGTAITIPDLSAAAAALPVISLWD